MEPAGSTEETIEDALFTTKVHYHKTPITQTQMYILLGPTFTCDNGAKTNQVRRLPYLYPFYTKKPGPTQDSEHGSTQVRPGFRHS